MPYISKERVKEIREAIKAKYPDFKFSVTNENHSSVSVAIMSGPLKLLIYGENGYVQVNQYWINDNYADNPEIRDFLLGVYEIMNDGNGIETDDGDYGKVPKFYTNISIGKYNKPYQVIESKIKSVAQEIVSEEASNLVSIIDYSEKAIAVIGNTKPIKDKLKELNGRFNFRLSCGPGWIFPKNRFEEIRQALGA